MGNRNFKEVDLFYKNITLEEYIRNTEDSDRLEINAYTYDRWIQSTGTLPFIIKNGTVKWKALFGDVYLSELKKINNLRRKNNFRITGSLVNFDERIELKKEIKIFFMHYKQSIKEWYPCDKKIKPCIIRRFIKKTGVLPENVFGYIHLIL